MIDMDLSGPTPVIHPVKPHMRTGDDDGVSEGAQSGTEDHRRSDKRRQSESEYEVVSSPSCEGTALQLTNHSGPQSDIEGDGRARRGKRARSSSVASGRDSSRGVKTPSVGRDHEHRREVIAQRHSEMYNEPEEEIIGDIE